MEQFAAALAGVRSTDDFFGQDGVFTRLFSEALEQMLEGEMSDHLGYERYEAKGSNSGNSRNGRYIKKGRTSTGESTLQVPRDCQGTFEPQILKHQEHNTHELEDKIIAMYAKGVSVRDIEDQLRELYGVKVLAAMISTITDKVRPSVLTDLRNRGVQDVFIACVDGLRGFPDAIQAIFPHAQVQSCILHQIRNSPKCVTWQDRKASMRDLKAIYQAATREEAETYLLKLGETWGAKYTIAVRSWEDNWERLATFFDYPSEIRRLINTTNAVEGYHRQLRKALKTKASFPTHEAARKLLHLVHTQITKKWQGPIAHWPKILHQLAILFQGRFPL